MIWTGLGPGDLRVLIRQDRGIGKGRGRVNFALDLLFPSIRHAFSFSS
jgi:hypothetical protein